MGEYTYWQIVNAYHDEMPDGARRAKLFAAQLVAEIMAPRQYGYGHILYDKRMRAIWWQSKNDIYRPCQELNERVVRFRQQSWWYRTVLVVSPEQNQPMMFPHEKGEFDCCHSAVKKAEHIFREAKARMHEVEAANANYGRLASDFEEKVVRGAMLLFEGKQPSEIIKELERQTSEEKQKIKDILWKP